MTSAILGIQPDYDGLRLNPCIPSNWPGFTAIRRFRRATYEITVHNPEGVCSGVARMEVDGKPMEGNLVPLASQGSLVRVSLTLGRMSLSERPQHPAVAHPPI
jgi:cellobiose phosphorylase